jgi:flavin reductase (DIM6/NTAB) family NADH-FMN oxidoreductase RutF
MVATETKARERRCKQPLYDNFTETLHGHEPEPAEFRKAMGCFATGVTIITVDLDGEVHGITECLRLGVARDPPWCWSASMRHSHARPPARQKRFGIIVLGETQRASRNATRVPTNRTNAEAEAGALRSHSARTPMLLGSLAFLNAAVLAQDAGDRTIFIGEVEDVVVRGVSPCRFSGELPEGWRRPMGDTGLAAAR